MGPERAIRFASSRVLRWVQSARPRVVLVACLVLVSVRLLGAQTTGTIVGAVRDKTGGVLPAVRLTTRHVDTGLTRSTARWQRSRHFGHAKNLTNRSWTLQRNIP